MGEFNFAEELKKMPQTPGVYLMHDAHDDVAYQRGVVVHQLTRQPADKRAADQGPQNGKKHDSCLLLKNFL